MSSTNDELLRELVLKVIKGNCEDEKGYKINEDMKTKAITEVYDGRYSKVFSKDVWGNNGWKRVLILVIKELKSRIEVLKQQLLQDKGALTADLLSEQENLKQQLKDAQDQLKDGDGSQLREEREKYTKLQEDHAKHATDPLWLVKQLQEVVEGGTVARNSRITDLEEENKSLKKQVIDERAEKNSRITALEAANKRLKNSLKATKKETAEELAAATVFVNPEDDEIVEATEELANTKDELEWAEETMMMQDEGLKKLNKQLGLESSSDDDDDGNDN